ncbi:MAG: WG repeat-containing protein [bacterium]
MKVYPDNIEQYSENLKEYQKLAVEQSKQGSITLYPLDKPQLDQLQIIISSHDEMRLKGNQHQINFHCHNQGETVEIINQENEKYTLNLPSPVTYHDCADLNPDGDKLAVGSRVRMRMVDLETGDMELVLEGPWLTGVAYLKDDTLAVLSTGGFKTLDLNDPDIKELSSVKNANLSGDSVQIQTAAMIHLCRSSNQGGYAYGIEVRADYVEKADQGKYLILRRDYVDQQDSWKTLILAFKHLQLTPLKKYPFNIGKIYEKDGEIFSSRGFKILGLEQVYQSLSAFRVDKINDSLDLELPASSSLHELKSIDSNFFLVETEMKKQFYSLPRGIKEKLNLTSSDWIAEQSPVPCFLTLRNDGTGNYTLSLACIEDQSAMEIVIKPRLTASHFNYDILPEENLMAVSFQGGTYLVDIISGKAEFVANQFVQVNGIGIVDKNSIVVLTRINQDNSELEIYLKNSGNQWDLHDIFPVHYFDQLYYFRNHKIILISNYYLKDNEDITVMFKLNDGMKIDYICHFPLGIADAWEKGKDVYVKNKKQVTYHLQDLEKLPETTSPVKAIKYELPQHNSSACIKLFEKKSKQLSYRYIDKNGKFITDNIFYTAWGFKNNYGKFTQFPHLHHGLINKQGVVTVKPDIPWLDIDDQGFIRIVYGINPTPEIPQQGKWGLLDNHLNWLLKPEFSYIGPMCEDRAVVAFENFQDGWINTQGVPLSPVRYNQCGDYSEGLAYVLIQDCYGYVDCNGEVAIPPQFFKADNFNCGLARIKLSTNLWGFIDKKGKIISRREFEQAYRFKQNFAVVASANKMGYLNKYGDLPFGLIFDTAYDFNDGLAPVIYGGKANYINEKGKILSPQGWDQTFIPEQGVGVFEVDGKRGYIDKQGNIIQDRFYKNAYSFSEGLAAACDLNSEKWGFIDLSGNWKIEPQFDQAKSFVENRAAVKLGQKWGYIDQHGEFRLKPQFDNAYDFSEGFAIVV